MKPDQGFNLLTKEWIDRKWRHECRGCNGEEIDTEDPRIIDCKCFQPEWLKIIRSSVQCQ